MANLEHVQKLMQELGPLVDEIGLVQQSGENLWLVVFGDQSAVEIECDQTGNKLIFSMVIGPVEGGQREQLYESLLCYNLLYRDTAGMRIALDGPDGNAVLLLDLCHLDLRVSSLAALLDVFVTTGLGWREVLRGAGAGGAPSAAEEDLSGALQA